MSGPPLCQTVRKWEGPSSVSAENAMLLDYVAT